MVDYAVRAGYLRPQPDHLLKVLDSSPDVGVVTLYSTSQPETPTESNIQKNQVCFETAPRGDASIRGHDHSIDEPNTAATTQAQAKVSVLHDRQSFVTAADGQEVAAPEKHGVVAE